MTTSQLAVGADLQLTVDKFSAALKTPYRLLNLAPKAAGHPGNAAALSPAIVLTTISAFEGFAEDFLATILALNGAGLGQIAKQVGSWNNPTLKDWTQRLENHISSTQAQQALSQGPATKIRGYRVNASGNWSQAGRNWTDVLTDSEAWMQVRHLLTHGLATGWGVETWPPPIKHGVPAASSVLRPKKAGKHTLDRTGAKTCANIYSAGARHVADSVAQEFGQTIDWSELPTFK